MILSILFPMLLCSSYLNVVLAIAIFDPLSDLLVYDTKINISLKRFQMISLWISVLGTETMFFTSQCGSHNVS
jgi:hypothetical protein